VSNRLLRWPFRRYWWACVLVGVLILIFVIILIPFDPDDKREVSLSRFVEFARAGEVSSVRLDDNDRDFDFKLSTTEDTYKTTKERELPLTQLLLDTGLTPQEISGIDITVKSGGSSSVVSLIVSILPIIIILAIVGYFLRMAANPQKLRAQMMGLVTNVDPVCKEAVNPGTAAGSSTFQSITYYFCSPEHKEQFDADPVRYLLQK
jgi:YHS domain-containing protein